MFYYHKCISNQTRGTPSTVSKCVKVNLTFLNSLATCLLPDEEEPSLPFS